MKNQYEVGDFIEITVDKIVPNGLGMCFAEGLTIFVPLSATGDRVRAEIRKIQGKVAFARIVEVLEPSKHRSEPVCAYFGECGGCDFQQMNYRAQLDAKVGIVRDCLERIGKLTYENEIPIIPSPEQYRYRLRAQWHADTSSKKIGYYKRQSHDIVDATSCPILIPTLEDKLNDLRESLPWNEFFSEHLNIEAASDANENVSIYSEEILEPTAELAIEVSNQTFFYNATSFFQANLFMLEQLVATAIGEFEGEHALDLYCGVGLFSIPLGKRFNSVLGIESSDESFQMANRNARRARSENVRFISSQVREFLADAASDQGSPDLILLDPPRSGVKPKVLKLLADLGAANISYVSCNPSTLARDIKGLGEYGYRVTDITTLDMFPQTHHVETVVYLSLGG